MAERLEAMMGDFRNATLGEVAAVEQSLLSTVEQRLREAAEQSVRSLSLLSLSLSLCLCVCLSPSLRPSLPPSSLFSRSTACCLQLCFPTYPVRRCVGRRRTWCGWRLG